MIDLGNILFYGIGLALIVALAYAAYASHQAHRDD